MDRRTGFKLGDTELTLLGTELHVGDKAPDFRATDKDLGQFTFADKVGKVAILISVPSVDTPVCELENIRFNEEVAAFGDKVQAYTLSMDLPFAQARFCGAKDISNLTMLSDYKDRDFGYAYGCHIEELGLLNRSVFVVDAEGKLAYVEYVHQNVEHPNYDAVLAKVRELVG